MLLLCIFLIIFDIILLPIIIQQTKNKKIKPEETVFCIVYIVGFSIVIPIMLVIIF